MDEVGKWRVQLAALGSRLIAKAIGSPENGEGNDADDDKPDDELPNLPPDRDLKRALIFGSVSVAHDFDDRQ